MPVYQTIIRNIFSNWAGLFFHMVIALFLSPFLVNSLGLSKYGIWILFGQIISYMGLMDLGIRVAVTSFISKYNAKGDSNATVEIINTSLLLYLILALVVLLSVFIFTNFINTIFHIEVEYLVEAKLTLLIIGLTLSTQLPANVFAGSISGMQRYDISNAISIAVTGVRTVVIVFCLSRNPSLITLAIITFVFEQVKNILFVIYAFRLLPEIKGKIKIFKWNLKRIKEIYSFSAYSFIMNIATRVIFYTDTIVIGIFLTTSQIAFYAIAWNLVEYSRKIVLKLAHVFAPAASNINALNQVEKLKDLYIFGTKTALLIAIPISVFLFFMGQPFLILWMGNKFSNSYPILLILLSAELLNSMLQPATNMILGMAKHKYIAWARVLEATCNLILSIILIHRFGLIGVAFGTLIPSFLVNSIFILPYSMRLMNLSAGKYFQSSIMRPLILMFFLCCLGYVLSKFFYPKAWLTFIACFATYLLCYTTIVYFVCLTGEEKKLVLSKLPLKSRCAQK